ncbi:hypothetical protein K443DRAFT_586133 [Laccaria amethystina LaAM-08-1]|uniref:Uncharacterized protein n=1 Tax=Laccaria amethystina LaAM-08-1 TaxID=1095629 RepID=A0A0C9YJ92_9AGAR|nr:hypothetical protein K443DRAFT_586133 [Laccaria amethystina LaAM-08-1]
MYVCKFLHLTNFFTSLYKLCTTFQNLSNYHHFLRIHNEKLGMGDTEVYLCLAPLLHLLRGPPSTCRQSWGLLTILKPEGVDKRAGTTIF